MKKRIIILILLLFYVGYTRTITFDVSNESGQNIEYTINKGVFKGWKELQQGMKDSPAIKSYGKITIQWRDDQNIYVSNELNRPVQFMFQVGGRYKIVEKNWLGKKLKPEVEIFLYSYKRFPDYLLSETRTKFLLPLTKVKEGIQKVKGAIRYYDGKIKESNLLVEQYGNMLKVEKGREGIKTLKKEISIAKKRIKAYVARKKECEALEKELLIREVIEIYKQKIKVPKGQAKMYGDSLRKHEQMLKKLLKIKKLPTTYLSA